jgi:hypothetical protein
MSGKVNSQGLQKTQGQSDLTGFLAVLDIDDETDTDVCRQGEIGLAKAEGSTPRADQFSEGAGVGDVIFWHGVFPDR